MTQPATSIFVNGKNVQAIGISVDQRHYWNSDVTLDEDVIRVEYYYEVETYVLGRESQSVLTKCRVAMSG